MIVHSAAIFNIHLKAFEAYAIHLLGFVPVAGRHFELQSGQSDVASSDLCRRICERGAQGLPSALGSVSFAASVVRG